MRTVSSFLICLLFTFSSSCGQTIQNNSTDKEAEKMLKDFYTNYFSAFVEPPSELSQKKLDMLQKQFCTEAFNKKIPEIIEQTDGDVFLKAQDSDIKYLKTLTVSKDLQKEEYIVSYIADATPEEKITITLHITLVKVGNNYKISSVR
jgi:hypothetical protein